MAHLLFLSLMLVTGCCTEESFVQTMKAAQVTIAPANQTVVVGQDITFTCTVDTSDPEPSLVMMWLRNVEYIEESITNQSFTNSSVILNMKNVKEADEGWYICFALNDWGQSYRSAWLTVLNAAELPYPVNMTVLRTPLGMLARWVQPNTSLPVEYYRVYHRKAGIENSDIWKTLDTNRSAIHILLSETFIYKTYDLKVQTKYSNGYFSRNVSGTVNLPDEVIQYKIYVFIGVCLTILLSVCILGIVRIWRYHALHSTKGQPQGIQSQGQGMNSGEHSERYSASNDEIHHYESVTSNDIDAQQPLTSNKSSNEAEYAQPYAETELGRVTTPKVVFTDKNYESANYIHPVAAAVDSSEWDPQYIHGRIPEDIDGTNYTHRVAAAIGSSS